MNKLFTSIAVASLSLTMAVGVGVAVGQSAKQDVTQVNAADASVTFSSLYSANTVLDGVAISIDSDTTVTFNKSSSGTATQYYTNGSAVRWYSGGTMAISSSKDISAIDITLTRTDNAITSDVGTYSSGSWTGNSKNVTFTQGGTSGHNRVSKVEITYKPVTSDPTITLNKASLTVEEGKDETFIVNTANCTADFDITGGNDSKFTLNYTASHTDGDHTITVHGVEATSSAITLTVSSTGATSQTIDISVVENPISSLVKITDLDDVSVTKVYALSNDGVRFAADSITSSHISQVTDYDDFGFVVLETNGTGYSLRFATLESGNVWTPGSVYINYSSGTNLTNGNSGNAQPWDIIDHSGNGIYLKHQSSSRHLGLNGTTDIRPYASSNLSSNLPVYLWEAGSLPQVACESISLTNTPSSSLSIGDHHQFSYSALDINGDAWTGDVSYASSDTSVATITSAGLLEAVDEGTADITVYTDSGTGGTRVTSTAFTVTVAATYAKGTEQNPYTVAEAIAAIQAGGDLTNKHTYGIVCQVDTYNETYHWITYWISDDGNTTTKLEAYHGKGLSGADFSALSDVGLGATVQICGTLKSYGTTYEYDADNYLVSYTAGSLPMTGITIRNSEIVSGEVSLGMNGTLQLDVVPNPEHSTTPHANEFTYSIDSSASDTGHSVTVSNTGLISAGTAYGKSALVVITSVAEVSGSHFEEYVIVTTTRTGETLNYIGSSWTPASSISVGDEIIIVDSGLTNELTSVSSNKGNPTAYSGTPSATYKLTVGTGSASGSFTLCDASGNYLAYTLPSGTTKNNSLFLITDLSGDGLAQASWTIDVTTNATITNVYNSERSLQFNSDRFCCYTGSQTAIKVLKAAEAQELTVSIESDLYSVMDSVNAAFQCDRSGATFDSTAWNGLSSLFTTAIKTKYHLDTAIGNASGNIVEQFLTDYDYVVVKYGSQYDFLSRNPSSQGLVNNGIFNAISTEATTAIIVVVALTSVTAIGAIFFVKRRKYN